MSQKRVQLPPLVVQDLKRALEIPEHESLPNDVLKTAEQFWYVQCLLGFNTQTLDPRIIAFIACFELIPREKLEAKPEAPSVKQGPKPFTPENWREHLNKESVLIIENGTGKKVEQRLGTVLDVIDKETGQHLLIRSGTKERLVPANTVKML